jgi:hypothetical protein
MPKSERERFPFSLAHVFNANEKPYTEEMIFKMWEVFYKQCIDRNLFDGIIDNINQRFVNGEQMVMLELKLTAKVKEYNG